MGWVRVGLWRRGGQQGTGTEHDEVVILGREVVACAYPAELIVFDDLACELRRGRGPGPRRPHPRAEPAPDSISAALLGVLQALTAAACASTIDRVPLSLPETGRRRVATLLHRRPGSTTLEPADETAVHDTVVEAAMTHHALSRDDAEHLGAAVLTALRIRGDRRL